MFFAKNIEFISTKNKHDTNNYEVYAVQYYVSSGRRRAPTLVHC